MRGDTAESTQGARQRFCGGSTTVGASSDTMAMCIRELTKALQNANEQPLVQKHAPSIPPVTDTPERIARVRFLSADDRASA